MSGVAVESCVVGSHLGIDVAFRSDVGRTRRRNEDFVSYYEPTDDLEAARSGSLYIVADGVGGASAGEIASEYAVRKVLAEYYASQESDLEERLIQAVTAANDDIYRYTDSRPRPMATTLVAAVVRGDELFVANVGDSRAYLVRNGEIRQVTEDHSLTAQMVRQGRLSPEEAEVHPKRNLLVRTVGGADTVDVDIFGGPLLLGDVVVLCTDGLTRYVSEAEITHAVCSMRPQQAVDQLVELANQRGGKDNITVLVLQVVEPDDDLDTEPRMRPVEMPPDLLELEQTLAAQRKPLSARSFALAWPPARLIAGAAAALAAGVLLLTLVSLAARSGASQAPANTPRSTPARAPGLTETPDAALATGMDVRFVTASGLYESPGLSAEEVFDAAPGQDAEVLGGPTWSDTGAVWWLLSLRPPGDSTVTGWAMQSVLERAP